MPEPMFDQLGADFFTRLVDAFYAGVEADELLRAMYPDDLSESRRHLSLFLIQYWGGPGTYMAERGHPRLRMRHAEFVIDVAARDSWLRAMRAALDSLSEELTDDQVAELDAYFVMAANSLRNT